MSDKITPEQLRKEAVAVERMHGETLTVDWRTKQANQLRAHADALEENARLTRECEFHAKQCARVDELRHRSEAELAKLRQHAEAMHEQLEELIGLSVLAMRAANRDGAEFDVAADLYEARESIRNYRADFPEEK